MAKPWERNWDEEAPQRQSPRGTGKPWERDWSKPPAGPGQRVDGTPKGNGFLGELKRPDGKVSTELSIGVQMDGRETQIPLLVPTLGQEEIQHLLSGGEATDAMVQKAVEHARQRMAQGVSPFAQQGEVPNPAMAAPASQPPAAPRPEVTAADNPVVSGPVPQPPRPQAGPPAPRNPAMSPGGPSPGVPAEDIPWYEVYRRAAVESLANNAMGFADAVANPSTLVDNPFYGDEFTTRSGAPVKEVDSGPRPTGEQLYSGFKALQGGTRQLLTGGGVPDIPQKYRESVERGDTGRRQHPFWAGAGKISGDALTIATGRAPIAAPVRDLEQRIVNRVADPSIRKMKHSPKRWLKGAWQSDFVKRVKRSQFRAAETATEAASLALLQHGDPIEVAAWAAGGQMAGSAGTELIKQHFRGGPAAAATRLGVAALGLGSVYQIAQGLTPGGSPHPSIVNSINHAFSHIKYEMMLGASAAMLGGGRMRSTDFGRDWTEVTDFIDGLRRGTTIAALNEWLDDDRIQPMVERAARDPGYFTKSQQRKLTRALNTENVSISETIDRMAESDPDFRSRMDVILSEQQPQGPQNPQARVMEQMRQRQQILSGDQ